MKKNTEVVVVRLSSEAKANLTELAEAEGIGLSTYIRVKLLNLLKRKNHADEKS